MAINKLLPGMLSNATPDGGTAANETFVSYMTSNNRVEFLELPSDTASRDTVSTNVDNYAAQLDANVNTISSNAATLVVGIDAAESAVDTVSSNIDTFASYANSSFATTATAANAFIRINTANTTANNTITGNVTANISSDTLTFTAGNGISFLANADAQSITFSAKLNAIRNDRFTADGTANTFTLSRTVNDGKDIVVAVDGVKQVHPNNYIVSGTTLTLNNTIPIDNGALVDVRHLAVSGTEGELRVVSSPSFSWQGTASGYVSGGRAQYPSGPPFGDNWNNIQKFPLTSDTGATDIADLTGVSFSHSGHSSSTDAYAAGVGPAGVSPPTTSINKFPFSSDTNASLLNGSLTYGNRFESYAPSNGWSSDTNAYLVTYTSPYVVIQKFPFSSDTDATSPGNFTVPAGGASVQSATFGYAAGRGQDTSDAIEKFPFSSDTDATDVTELSAAIASATGLSSSTAGYVVGGGLTAVDRIEKFPFSAETSISDIAELGGVMYNMGSTGISGENAGYATGGRNSSGTSQTSMFKVNFTSDTPAPSIGSLAVETQNQAGHHV